jgi:hypothetical protein
VQAVEKLSMNFWSRKKDAERITQENIGILGRILSQKPQLPTTKLESDHKASEYQAIWYLIHLYVTDRC